MPRDAWLEKALHPAGRCTCGVGGFGGTCDWCVMDRRREKREVRRQGRAVSVKFQEPATNQGPTDEEAQALVSRDAERGRKREAQRAKQARRRRTGRR